MSIEEDSELQEALRAGGIEVRTSTLIPSDKVLLVDKGLLKGVMINVEVRTEECAVCGKPVTHETVNLGSSDGLVHSACLSSKD